MDPIGIFLAPAVYYASVHTGNERTSNMPIFNSAVKVYKGANSKLRFIILNADAKPVEYTDAGRHLEFRIFNTRTKKIVVTRRLEKEPTVTTVQGTVVPTVHANNNKRSIYSAGLTVTDTVDLAPGSHYSWCIVEMDMYANAEYLTTSLHDTVTGELHILNNAQPQMEPSVILKPEDFRKTTTYKFMDPDIVGDENNALVCKWAMYTSSAIAGDVFLNTTDGLHTIALYPDNFTGVIQLHATLEATPPDDLSFERWFNIPLPGGGVNVECNQHSSIIPFNFVGNFMWIRVVYYVMEEITNVNKSITRVLLRR